MKIKKLIDKEYWDKNYRSSSKLNYLQSYYSLDLQINLELLKIIFSYPPFVRSIAKSGVKHLGLEDRIESVIERKVNFYLATKIKSNQNHILLHELI